MFKRIYVLPALIIALLIVNIYERVHVIDPNSNFATEIAGQLTECSSFEETANVNIAPNPSIPLNNKLLAWGLSRRGNNDPPDTNPGSVEMIKKFGGFHIGDATKKKIYLTFDEGYENGYTEKILDVLRDNNVKAAFFVTGPYIATNYALMKRMIDEGHEVANHTVKHSSLPKISDEKVIEDITGLDDMLYLKFGKKMKFFRFPKGEYSERTLYLAQKLGYRTVFWSLAYDDWYRDKERGADFAKNLVLRNLHNGAVILLHAVSRDNAEALDSIIKEVRIRGYEFGSLDEIK